MAVPLTLKVFKGDELLGSHDYDRDIIKIGRLASAHLVVDDEKVSRIHSVIEVTPDGRLSIIDMGSVEGTYVNGKRVNKGALTFGDEIKIGATTIKVENATAKAAQNLAEAAKQEPSVDSLPPQAAADPGQAVAQTARAAVESEPPVQARAEVPDEPENPPAPQGPGAIDSSFAITEQNPVVEPMANPRMRPVRRKGKGPLGLELRLLWGNQIVGEYFLQPGKKSSFTVGTAPGVDFIMGDKRLGAAKFEAVTYDGQSYAVRFRSKMTGELERKGEIYDIKRILESGRATQDGEAYSLALGKDDFFWVDLGDVTLEACFQPVPKPAFIPFLEKVDFLALNVFLLIFFLGALFVVTALNRQAEGDDVADDLNDTNSAITKLLIKPPDIKQNPFLQALEKAKKAEAPQSHAGDEGKMGKQSEKTTDRKAAVKAVDRNSKDQARMMVAKIFGRGSGISTLFGRAGLGGELQAAMGNMTGRMVGDAFGTGGLGLKGGGGGGGGTGNTVGIGNVGTRGVSGGNGNYGNGAGILGGKKGVDIGITSSTPEVMGSLDPELIRRVIRSHVDQIRYCYEEELPSHPNLSGKVAVKFLITSQGMVATAGVAQSTVNNARLELCISGRVRTWVFPKPKGGGNVIVTYPFVLKQAG